MASGVGKAAALLLGVTLVLTGCGTGAAADPPALPSAAPSPAFTPTPTPTPTDPEAGATDPAAGATSASSSLAEERPLLDDGAIRLGCHTYCLNAGGYGGDDDPKKEMTDLKGPSSVAMLADGTIGLQVRCRVRLDCVGAILVSIDTSKLEVDDPTDYSEDGRSDLEVPAGQTRRLAVPLPEMAVTLLANGQSVPLDISLDTHPTYEKHSAKRRKTLEWVPGFDVTVVAP